MPQDPGVFARGLGRGQILVHLENEVILLIIIASRQKAFILGQDVHWRLYFYCVASDTRVHTRRWGRRSKFRTFKTLVFLERRMRSDSDVHAFGGAKGQNLVQLLRTEFFLNFFEEMN